MLFNEVVQQNCDAAGVCADAAGTWVTSKQFYAGLGVVQALPGPLFNFSAYLGAIMALNSGYLFLWGTLLAWFGLFTPGILVGGSVLGEGEGEA
jgi:chromate transporter